MCVPIFWATGRTTATFLEESTLSAGYTATATNKSLSMLRRALSVMLASIPVKQYTNTQGQNMADEKRN